MYTHAFKSTMQLCNFQGLYIDQPEYTMYIRMYVLYVWGRPWNMLSRAVGGQSSRAYLPVRIPPARGEYARRPTFSCLVEHTCGFTYVCM